MSVAGGFQLRAEWQSVAASYVDTLYVATDAVPPVAAARALMLSDSGFRPLDSLTLPRFDAGRRVRLAADLPPPAGGWRLGRFYPLSVLPVPLNQGRAARTGFARCVGCDSAGITFDANHPLSARVVRLLARGVADAQAVRSRLVPALSRLLDGPGMQAPPDAVCCDFDDPDAWRREDESDDRRFYAPPRLVAHLDDATIEVLAQLHARLLPRAARILDLMASWRSHLPAVLAPTDVIGLGLNEIELAANRTLTGRVVQDLNRCTSLPFADRVFDAAICSVSVDYLCRPQVVFSELRRVMRPGGLLVVSFSDRWFPTKVVRLWRRLLDFERLGLVLDHFRRAGFTDLHGWTLRGLPRPATDRHSDRSLVADPLFVGWGRAPAG